MQKVTLSEVARVGTSQVQVAVREGKLLPTADGAACCCCCCCSSSKAR
ncbi:hypothetical protein SAMN05443575_1210 [Jatrophihabitans endophyticus]|uniref:Uncharacterized protein n=1 Tax=Jatrophihabitans endophyticus TaxID=1206085 RepID=A0A1M5GKZ0_9ACTN|nr:hypothetical protein [Jatrophihabitans endophyticus]SHG04363.1 hypothetical protein SAMN05443575_1210 [Jatrophihabitans endophyticus]